MQFGPDIGASFIASSSGTLLAAPYVTPEESSTFVPSLIAPDERRILTTSNHSFRPGPGAAPFIMVIVKIPILQILVMLLAFFILALEWPLPLLKKTSIHRNLVVRVVLLFFQSFLTVLFYQVRVQIVKLILND